VFEYYGGIITLKGLILSGGLGTRLRPMTYSQQKQLIPVANKPVLFYGIEDLIEAGIKDIGIIVGPNKDQVMEMVNTVKWDADISFINQDEPLGLAHTIKISKDFLKDDSFVMYLGDNILRRGVVDFVNDFNNSDCEASVLLNEVDNPWEFGIAKLNSKNEIERVIEKPKDPPSNLAVIGVYAFKSTVHQAVEHIKPSWRNQLEIVDAIQWLIDNGYTVKSGQVTGWWKDTGRPEDILEANHLILDGVKKDIQGKVLKSKVKGRVVTDSTCSVENSVVKGPCILGKNVVVKNSYIGPYTSIGEGSHIESSEIEDSVVMNDAEIVGVSHRITDSLIGKNVKIMKGNGFPTGNKYILGDFSQIII
jgi:glucose-1-phosphate thymidylyltransferase